MIHEETVKVFRQEYIKHKISGSVLDGNGGNVFWYPNIPVGIKRTLCVNYNLNAEEEILFVEDNRDWGLVIITDCFIDCKGEDFVRYRWDKIEKVTFDNNQLNLWGYGGDRDDTRSNGY